MRISACCSLALQLHASFKFKEFFILLNVTIILTYLKIKFLFKKTQMTLRRQDSLSLPKKSERQIH